MGRDEELHEAAVRFAEQNERLQRLLDLLHALQAQAGTWVSSRHLRASLRHYADRTPEASRQALKRDLDALRALGVEIEGREQPSDEPDASGAVRRQADHAYRLTPEANHLPPVDLEPADLSALCLAASVSGLGPSAAGLVARLEAAAGGVGPVRTPPAPVADAGVPAALTASVTAVQQRRPLRFAYRTADWREGERTVDPWAVLHRAGRWYLVGRDHQRDERRAFRLDRVSSPPQPCGPPGSFEPPELDPDTASLVPDRPPGGERTATVAAAPDAAVRLARQAGQPERAELPVDEVVRDGRRWPVVELDVASASATIGVVLAAGEHAEVLAPDWLRAEVARRLAAQAGWRAA